MAAHRHHRLLHAGALLLCALGAQAQNMQVSFDLSVPQAPTPVAVEGQVRLVHELHLSNFASHALNPVHVDVRDADSGAVLGVFAGQGLEARLDRSGLQASVPAGAPIAPGRRGIVFFELALPPGTPVPARLVHRVDYRVADTGATAQVEGGGVAVARGAAVTLGAPLRGGPWVAIHDPAWARGHRRVVYAMGGRARTPGRFAVDWVKLDARGRKSARDTGATTDAYSHGEDVLAVADGTVVHVRADLPERDRLDAPADHRLETGSGNHVALDLGGGRYAFYGHLRPGSVRVAPGQRVRRGDKIAEVGFSGSASDPQLHFHVADAPGALEGEGLPFALARFRAVGAYARIEEVGRMRWTEMPVGTAPRRDEWLGRHNVVQFDD